MVPPHISRFITYSMDGRWCCGSGEGKATTGDDDDRNGVVNTMRWLWSLLEIPGQTVMKGIAAELCNGILMRIDGRPEVEESSKERGPNRNISSNYTNSQIRDIHTLQGIGRKSVGEPAISNPQLPSGAHSHLCLCPGRFLGQFSNKRSLL